MSHSKQKWSEGSSQELVRLDEVVNRIVNRLLLPGAVEVTCEEDGDADVEVTDFGRAEIKGVISGYLEDIGRELF